MSPLLFPAVYSEQSLPRTSRELVEELGVDRTSRNGVSRLCAPGAHINTVLPDEAAAASDAGFYGNGLHDDKRASGGEMVVPVIQRVDSSGDVLQSPAGMSLAKWVWLVLTNSASSLCPSGFQADLLMDYHLVPGAEWSRLREGESVCVLGRLPNGWYRCMALRRADCRLGTDPSYSIMSGLSEISLDSGLAASEGQRSQVCWSGHSVSYECVCLQCHMTRVSSVFPRKN